MNSPGLGTQLSYSVPKRVTRWSPQFVTKRFKLKNSFETLDVCLRFTLLQVLQPS